MCCTPSTRDSQDWRPGDLAKSGKHWFCQRKKKSLLLFKFQAFSDVLFPAEYDKEFMVSQVKHYLYILKTLP